VPSSLHHPPACEVLTAAGSGACWWCRRLPRCRRTTPTPTPITLRCRFLYVQLWKVNQEDGAPAPGNATRSGQAGADLRQAANSSTPFTTWAPTGSPDQPVIQDVYMVAAMGQEPALQVTSNGSVHFSPGLHVKDSAPGAAGVPASAHHQHTAVQVPSAQAAQCSALWMQCA